MTQKQYIAQLEAQNADLRRQLEHARTRPAVVRESSSEIPMREAARLYCAETGKRSVTPAELRAWRAATLAH